MTSLLTSDTFTTVFRVLIGEEGGYSNDPQDPGNWTGGKTNVGQLRGTKFGISAAAWPDVDIVNLTIDQAQLIYHGHYWSPIHGDSLPSMLALIVFDAAVNNGVARAVQWLQMALGGQEQGQQSSNRDSQAATPQAFVVDGVFGPITLGTLAATTISVPTLCSRVMDYRTWFMTSLSSWPHERGWCTRLTKLPWIAQQLFTPKRLT